MKSKRDILNSAKIREKKRRALKRRVIAVLVLFVFLIAGCSFLSKINAFAITTITVSGNSVIETSTIQQIAEETVAGNYLFLFSRRNVLLYPRRSIQQAIADASLRIADVHVALSGRHTLAITLTEREPAYVWCGESLPVENEKQQCYFLDAGGYAFSEAPYFSGDVYFKFYGPLGNDHGVLGSHFLDPERISVLHDAGEAFKDFGFKPFALSILGDGTYALILESSAGNIASYPKILFREENTIATIKQNLAAAIVVEPFATKIKKEFSRLEYIDLRYDNKVYYKFDE